MSFNSSRARLAVVARVGACLLLLVALWNPQVKSDGTPVDAIILLDASASMAPDFIQQAWPEARDALRQLSGDVAYTLIRFSGSVERHLQNADEAAVVEAISTMLSFDGDRTHTNIQTALDSAIAETRYGRPAFLFLLSDGAQTEGEAARALQRAAGSGLTVYSMSPPSDGGADQIRIERVSLPRMGREGSQLSTSVTVTSSQDYEGRIDVTIDGQLAESRPLQLRSGETKTTQVFLEALSRGVHGIEFSVPMPDDPFQQNNRVSNTIDIAGMSPVLYVNNPGADSPVARSLIGSGRDVEIIRPSQLAQRLESTGTDIAVFLDDIPAGGVQNDTWEELARRVRNDGAGLVVLGGAHSFGAGGYRGSKLESILPVTSESGTPLPPVSMIFVIDKSGSMDNTVDAASRFHYARKAVFATADSLMPGDQIGLIAFDTTAHVWLPLANYATPDQTLADAWQDSPAGGTRLLPAIELAISQLASSAPDDKLLILVTDGFLPAEPLDDAILKLEASEIRTLAMAVGDEPHLSILRRLTDINEGELFRVSDVTTLPVLMNASAGKLRMAFESEPTRPIEVSPLPFAAFGPTNWPALTGYMVTRERENAQVYLRSQRNDPLLASHLYGLGRVIALPSGLSNWAGDWQTSPHWSEFVGGLANWVNSRFHANTLYVLHENTGLANYREVDALSADGEWNTDDTSYVFYKDSSGHSERLAMTAKAPGRFGITLPQDTDTHQQLSFQLGDQSVNYDSIRAQDPEMDVQQYGNQNLQTWSEAGLLTNWSEKDVLSLPHDAPGYLAIRPYALIAAAFLYLMAIVVERATTLPGQSTWRKSQQQLRDLLLKSPHHSAASH